MHQCTVHANTTSRTVPYHHPSTSHHHPIITPVPLQYTKVLPHHQHVPQTITYVMQVEDDCPVNACAYWWQAVHAVLAGQHIPEQYHGWQAWCKHGIDRHCQCMCQYFPSHTITDHTITGITYCITYCIGNNDISTASITNTIDTIDTVSMVSTTVPPHSHAVHVSTSYHPLAHECTASAMHMHVCTYVLPADQHTCMHVSACEWYGIASSAQDVLVRDVQCAVLLACEWQWSVVRCGEWYVFVVDDHGKDVYAWMWSRNGLSMDQRRA